MNRFFLISAIFLVFASLLSSAPLAVVDLKSEHLENPIQLDVERPQLSWKLVAESNSDRGRGQSAYRVLVASSKELLQEERGDLWDSGRVESDDSVLIRYAGEALVSRQACYWKVRVWDESGVESDWSKHARWTMALLEVEDWEGSDWIGLGEDTRTSSLAEREFVAPRDSPGMMRSYASPLLRKEIVLSKPIARAMAYVAGVGYSEFYLNGEKVGDAVLDPGQTNYETHTLYVTHDITDALRKGRNALGLWLGSGFFGQNVAWKHDFDYGQPRARAKLFVEYEDGTSEVFGTDASWKATVSPIVFDNVYWGETYDARLEIPEWASVACDESEWQDAVVLEEPCPTDRLRSQLIAPIRVQREIEAVEVKDVGNGTYVVDFGENLAGWVAIDVELEAGEILTLTAGEVMEPDGITVNTGTSGGAPGRKQEMIYVGKGEGRERWSPRFSYHGFQYVEVSGLRSPPKKSDFTAKLVHSEIETTGSFSCSEETLNRQYEITQRTLEANWHSIPEDCPAREKCGWLGDAHATSDISFYGYDMTRFLGKYLRDIEDSLKTNARYDQVVGHGPGIPTFVAPGKRVTDRPAEIDWAVAYVILNWDLYLHTGDVDVFARHYQNIKNFVAYFESMRGPNEILPSGLGDWCPPLWDRKHAPEYMLCHPHVSGTAFFYRTLQIAGDMAEVFGDKVYGDYCSKLAADVKDAFNEAYLVEGGAEDSLFYGSQTATVMALKFGMVPEERIDAVVRGLVHDIEVEHQGHYTVGIHGLRHIYTVLSDYGHEALVARMLVDRSFPGPGYLVDHGFSTWPERQFNWDEEPRYRNSMNHPMQGGFAAFFYEGVGGIRPLYEGAGYKTFELRPRLTRELEWARVSKETPYGIIKSDWKRTRGGLAWEIEVPINSTGVVYLPVADLRKVTESGMPLSQVDGVLSVEPALDARRDSLKVTLGSGRYSFLVGKESI
ncbi:alpha-L-rhamnosidase [Pelagicoccus mobilis]|uniref:alpha-L-rhamnosidase n=1 Tax=Pelagicoccus mobilis TaxID=415221 RepID=A0A934RZP3_9BACT|nr:alpha-L-rhamnosidase [Pelagicoccus mobilis]MBK1876438.1 family 78 glycoside hydrolase catalytic domain [Pelagicoccus mobilis]